LQQVIGNRDVSETLRYNSSFGSRIPHHVMASPTRLTTTATVSDEYGQDVEMTVSGHDEASEIVDVLSDSENDDGEVDEAEEEDCETCSFDLNFNNADDARRSFASETNTRESNPALPARHIRYRNQRRGILFVCSDSNGDEET
jgi:hypothetical protein